MTDEVVGTHVFNFQPGDNGGEALILVTKMLSNGDPSPAMYLNQQLTLQSYCNSASFELVGTPLMPEVLRKLANELESAMVEARMKLPQPQKT